MGNLCPSDCTSSQKLSTVLPLSADPQCPLCSTRQGEVLEEPLFEVKERPEHPEFDYEIYLDELLAHEREDLAEKLVAELADAVGITAAHHEDREKIITAMCGLSASGKPLRTGWFSKAYPRGRSCPTAQRTPGATRSKHSAKYRDIASTRRSLWGANVSGPYPFGKKNHDGSSLTGCKSCMATAAESASCI